MKKMALPAIIVSLLSLPAAYSASGNIDRREYVCMMQDMVLTKPGIAIKYAGKTYYGCCEMCKEKIRVNPKKYTRSLDLVSRKPVDKARAYVYGLNGDAYYFSSEANRRTFAKDPQKYLLR